MRWALPTDLATEMDSAAATGVAMASSSVMATAMGWALPTDLATVMDSRPATDAGMAMDSATGTYSAKESGSAMMTPMG